THAVCTAVCLENPFIAEIHQCAQAFFNDKDNIRAFTAVAACRSPVRYIFFAAECDHSISAVPTSNINFYVIDKHIIPPSVRVWRFSSHPVRTLSLSQAPFPEPLFLSIHQSTESLQ